MKKRLVLTVLTGVLLAGCAHQPTNEATGKAVQQTREGFGEAAMTPLEDLNLKRDPIPAILREIENPYDVPLDLDCAAIEAEIIALNDVLGPDWDAAPKKDDEDSSISDKAADTASDGVLDTVSSTAGGIIPYRGWVRQLTGASAHEKKVRKAYERGSHRRTYLKAIGLMKGCDPVATPNFAHVRSEENIEFRGDAPKDYTLPDAEGPAPRPEQAMPPRKDLQTSEVTEEPMSPAQPSQPAINSAETTSSLPRYD